MNPTFNPTTELVDIFKELISYSVVIKTGFVNFIAIITAEILF